jgi:hypothetical protein
MANPTPGFPGDLRDWFAGQALIALTYAAATQQVDDYGPRPVASDAYNFADRMMVERLIRDQRAKREGGQEDAR